MDVVVSEVKNVLHKLVVETDDVSILSKVEAYFYTLKNKETDWWDSLSESDIKSIELGVEQLNNGQRIAHPDVRLKVDNLLGRK
jgi:hypothetical protein